jgi:hypothetical protein
MNSKRPGKTRRLKRKQTRQYLKFQLQDLWRCKKPEQEEEKKFSFVKKICGVNKYELVSVKEKYHGEILTKDRKQSKLKTEQEKTELHVQDLEDDDTIS